LVPSVSVSVGRGGLFFFIFGKVEERSQNGGPHGLFWGGCALPDDEIHRPPKRTDAGQDSPSTIDAGGDDDKNSKQQQPWRPSHPRRPAVPPVWTNITPPK
jgi:hypothetical protein